ncbi:MAG: hypothetical protein JEZ08_22360 [Clostridiales bacterium]|nr:hypothetical protein [Clostridiales bacterium]
MHNISEQTIKNGLQDYRQLKRKLSGCSFGEAMSSVRIRDNVNIENSTFDFTYGNIRGKIYQDNQLEVKVCSHVQIFDENILEYSDLVSTEYLDELS